MEYIIGTHPKQQLELITGNTVQLENMLLFHINMCDHMMIKC